MGGVAATRTRPPARVAPVRADLARLIPSGRSLLVCFAIIGFAAGAYAVARETPVFAVRTVEVEGAPPDVAADVRVALAADRGKSLLALSRDDAVARVEALPSVIAARADRSFPNTLRIVVRPERPVAVLRRGRDSWLVSARGRVVRRVARSGNRGLPRVWIPRAATVAVGSILDDRGGGVAARAVALLQSTGVGGVRGAVLSERDGLVFVLRSGVEVRLGAPVDVALKLAVARRIVPLLPQGSKLLDLSVPERPVSETNPQPEGRG